LPALEWLESTPDKGNNWLAIGGEDYGSFMPLIAKETKFATARAAERAVFKLFSMGVITARDEWVYGLEDAALEPRVKFLIDAYNRDRERLSKVVDPAKVANELDYSVKWTRSAKRDLMRSVARKYDRGSFVDSLYRPFVRKRLYFGTGFIEMPNQMPAFFRTGETNRAIFFNDRGSRSPFSPLASAAIAEYHLAASTDGFQGVGYVRFDEDGSPQDNITDWSLDQFKKRYQPGRGKKDRAITKEAIFHYVYGVLHDPVYREKYALNLKREFPRIPFYVDFWQWADWGRALMDLHISFESVPPFALARTDVPDEKARRAGLPPKAILRSDAAGGRIVLDSETVLAGVPAQAWDYRLGNRSALDWVLDQHKEKTPRDPTIREKFNTYRFADYKDKVIDLLARVTTVSVETMKIVEAMKRTSR
jgi:predicted helicase